MVLPAAAQPGQFESEVAGPTEQTERQAGSADVQLTEGPVYFGHRYVGEPDRRRNNRWLTTPPVRLPARVVTPRKAERAPFGSCLALENVDGGTLKQDSNPKPMIVNLSEFRSFQQREAVRFRLLRASLPWWIKAWLESQANQHEQLSRRKPGGRPGRVFRLEHRS
jgi:hypothetical protein